MSRDNKNKLSKENLTEILQLFGDRLAFVCPQKKWHLVVCGGAALAVLDLVQRTTKDIDVIGQLSDDHIEYADFTTQFREQISIVADYYQLPENWINKGPESFLESGLPQGLVNRLTKKEYGPSLCIGFISRYDQIFLKVYASVDRGGYHVDDLLTLNPSEQELIEACNWVRNQDVSEQFSMLLHSMLKQIGYENVARKL